MSTTMRAMEETFMGNLPSRRAFDPFLVTGEALLAKVLLEMPGGTAASNPQVLPLALSTSFASSWNS